jgi:predicted XRE-type DNA-binding protein
MNTDKRHLVQLQKALIPVTKMVIKFGLQYHEFRANSQKAYIKAAEELLHEATIKPTNQAIAVKTGIDRRTIAEFQSNPSANKDVMNKMDLVIAGLQRAKLNSKHLTHSHLTTLIDGIYGNHIRAKAVITELISNEMIVKTEHGYLIAKSLNQQLLQQAELAEEVDITTKRLFQTFYKKMFATDHKQNLNQASILSSKIPHSKHDVVNQIIDKKMRQFQAEMRELIKQHETNVPQGTYANVGFSQFQFDSSE